MGTPSAHRALAMLVAPFLLVVGAVGANGTSVPSGPRTKNAVRARSAPAVLSPMRRIMTDRAKPADELVLAAVGDIMLGSTFTEKTRVVLPPHDGRDLLRQVAPVLSSADITFGNLEGPLLDFGGKARRKCRQSDPGCHFFRMPTRYAASLKAAGFNVVSVANNHAFDFGEAGSRSTRRALDRVGVSHSGKLGDIARLQVKGKKVDLIAFSTSPRTYSVLEVERAAEVVRRAAQEADVVIVSFHGGGEGAKYQFIPPGGETYLRENRGDVVQFAHAMIDAGAHVVCGHGPHVVRGMEFYRGRLIAYSLGNFATFSGISVRGVQGLSMILEVHLGLDGSFRSARAYPVKQEYRSGPQLDADRTVLSLLRDLSATQFGDTGAAVSDSGEVVPRAVAPEITLPAAKAAGDHLQ